MDRPPDIPLDYDEDAAPEVDSGGGGDSPSASSPDSSPERGAQGAGDGSSSARSASGSVPALPGDDRRRQRPDAVEGAGAGAGPTDVAAILQRIFAPTLMAGGAAGAQAAGAKSWRRAGASSASAAAVNEEGGRPPAAPGRAEFEAAVKRAVKRALMRFYDERGGRGEGAPPAAAPPAAPRPSLLGPGPARPPPPKGPEPLGRMSPPPHPAPRRRHPGWLHTVEDFKRVGRKLTVGVLQKLGEREARAGGDAARALAFDKRTHGGYVNSFVRRYFDERVAKALARSR
jgi:hypothetical protein